MIMGSIAIIVAWAIVGFASAEIINDPSLCGRTKCIVPATRKFKYEPETIYRYRYSVDVSTNLGSSPEIGAKRNESSLYVDATVTLRFTSPCEGRLRVENASLSHDRAAYNPLFPDRAGADFKESLERYPLRFAYDDGRVRELCPHRRDPVWSVNAKRGILSMLQNAMRRFDVDRRLEELDVHGLCDTRYRLHEARRTSLVVRKTKNLDACTHGAKHLSVLQSSLYRSPRSGERSRQPLLASTSECEVTIDHNVYERVVCRDVNRLQPLATGHRTGPRAETVATLQLVEERKAGGYYEDYEEEEDEEEEEENFGGYENDRYGHRKNFKRTTLLYDHTKTPKTIHGELRTSRDLLKSLCRLNTGTDELQQKFSETFTAFVHSARSLDYPSLSQLFNRANGICKTGKKHVINALPFMGSNPAVNVMRDLIVKKLYPDEGTLNKWITTFGLIPRPDQDTVKILSTLLEHRLDLPGAQFSLSYSAMIHAYCANADGDCSRLEPIRRFVELLDEKVARGCAPRSHSVDSVKETLEALKAIGNAGLATKSLLANLKTCIDDAGGFLPMEIRVAAVDAHRRLPSCEATRDQYFLDYYRNFTLDAEIRIASYLQVMRCPDYNVVKTIKHTLRVEEVNQVGSFVWSHLTNLYNSASPTRLEVQSLLTDRDLDGKFNSDLRKFSRSYEGSFFSEEYNFGGNYQSNLIFSPKSYVPRTVTFNLTFDLFGESVNVVEVTARLEGIEYYAESAFGPDGPYSNERISSHLRNFLRSFRSAPEDDDYWKRVKRLPSVIDNNFDRPQISLSYKIFGNELTHTMLNGDAEIRAALATLNPWEKVKQILSGQEIHYESTMMLMDSAYVVPTTSGLPVRLELAGSAAYNFRMSGSLDAKRLSSHGEVEVIGNVMPSVTIDAVGSVTVDAFYKSAGLKLRTNVYSSGSLQVHLNVQGARLVRLSLGLPNERMEVFTVQTDVLLTSSNGAEIEERPLGVLVVDEGARRRLPRGAVVSNTTCSWAALDRLVGLKLCTDYQFSNVTKNPSAPYFILSGPTLFKVSLIKADPTAKSYLFEYKWQKTEDNSVLRLVFDTPGSVVKRELSATVTFNTKNHNVTVLLQSAGNSLVAKGTYKRTENETSIDIGFIINGTNHLDASVGYTTKKFAYGYTYSPKLHLTINNERVAALTGAVRYAQKSNVSQCDIDLTFQTKRVWSKMVGYIVKRNVSLAGDFQLDYQLQKMPRKERLHLEIGLINQSTKTVTHKSANLKLRSTAYPQLNTVINAWYQQALGHLELHAEVNSSPYLQDNRHKLTAKLLVSYSKVYFQNQGTKFSILFAITKPVQNLDIKIGVNHYAVGAESKSSLLVGYAPGKEISLVVNTIMPRGLLFSMEGHANLTIPNFNSLLINARVNERSRREYELDFSGTWFSGHNITARGTYIDRSTTVVVSHNLKVVLTSPSFANDVSVNCKLYQDMTDLLISLYVEQFEMDKYAFVLNYTVISPTRLLSFVEGRYKRNVYSLTTSVDVEREVRVELHLDQWRDVHLTLTAIKDEDRKEFGVELKWDANRDPALKIATILRLYREYGPPLANSLLPQKNFTAAIVLSYPGRLVNGVCLVALRGPYSYMVDAEFDWDPEKGVRLTVDMDYDVQVAITSLKLESQLLTPFENWKKTAFNAKYLQTENKLLASSSAYWKDSQHIVADFSGSTLENGATKEWLANCGLTSTVHSIGFVTANLTHKVLRPTSADTRLLLKYEPDKVIDFRSIWYLDGEPDNIFNLTGNLHLESPLENYRNGDMRCQLRLLPDWKFDGAANLELEKRRFTGRLVGDLARLRESMVQFNVTTPIEKYAYVRGNFGLSERNRHVVAELVTPAGPLGFEAICRLFASSYDFHVKLLLATPVEALQRTLLVAKLNRREADFRVAYNNATVGFQGVWHYRNVTDFYYSYILYTPLHGLHECGVITKLIVARDEPDGRLLVDTEFSVRLVEVKVGFKAKGGPKPPPVHISIKNPLQERGTGDDESEEEEEDAAPEDCYYWRGDLEIYPAIIEPIVGVLDVDNEDLSYKILGSLQLPQGKIIFDDQFVMRDYFSMKNDLSIETPFASCSEITSKYFFNIDLESSVYLVGTNVRVKNAWTWHEGGYSLNYSQQRSEVDSSKIHTMILDIKTPLAFLQELNTKTVVEVDENFYKTQLALRTDDCRVDVLGSLELDEKFIDTTLSVMVDSPMLTIPTIRIVAKKDFTDREKQLKFGLAIAEPAAKSMDFQAAWQVQGQNYAEASLSLDTWLYPLKHLTAHALYVNSIATNGTGRLSLNVRHQPGQRESRDPGDQRDQIDQRDRRYSLVGDYKDGLIDAELLTPIPSNERFTFHGNVVNVNETAYEINGDLTNLETSALYKVFGIVRANDNDLSSVETTIEPRTGNPADRITLTLRKQRYGLKLDALGRHFNGSVRTNVINAVNWDVRSQLETYDVANPTNVDRYQFSTFMNVQVNGNTSFYVHATTPWRDVERFTVSGNALLTNSSGDVRVDHERNRDRVHLNFLWNLDYMIDMFARLVASYRIEGLRSPGSKDLDARIFLRNPKRAYRNVDVGFDVDVDREAWKFAANATIGYKNTENIDAVFSARLPPPDNDDHRFLISYHANKGIQDLSYVVGYNALKAKTNYASDGSVRMATRDIDGHLRVTWGMSPEETMNNLFNVTFDKKEIELKYSLFTPRFLQEETLVVLFNYDGNSDDKSLLNADVFYPARKQVGTARISYASLVNVNGTLNASMPIKNFNYAGCNFVVFTTLKQNKRFVEIFWPNKTALLNSNYVYNSERLDSNLEGTFQLEIPLNTRHVGLLTYGYKKRPQVTTGFSTLTYNAQKILEGEYKCKSESRAGFEKDHIDITVQNVFMPIGIVYVNQYEYSAGNEGTNYPTVEFKHVDVYRLDNRTAFNITGESKIRTTHSGQEIFLKALHSNRTVQLKTEYEVLSGEFDQTTWLSLADDAWISYHVNILNKTTEETENQFLVVSLAYPRRNFTLDGSYRITADRLSSEARLEWDRETDSPRTVAAGFDWENVTAPDAISHQRAVLSLRHPSFDRDVTLTGRLLRREPRDLVNASFEVDYSADPEKVLVVLAGLRDESDYPHDRKYVYRVVGRHPRTRFDLDVGGFLRKHGNVYAETRNRGRYRRSFMPEETGELSGHVDVPNRDVHFHRESNELVKHFRLRYYSSYPQYVVNGSIINTPNLNATGEFFFDPQEKFTWMMVNYTPDAVESLRMYGKIPDARNAVFDIWRTYEEGLTVSDVSFYVKLNHSRLVTSTLKWRPELKSDITTFVKTSLTNAYDDFNKDVDYWKQYVKSETVSILSDVWDDAQEDLRGFLNDWNDLKNLERDFEDLKIYLNDSYNANDFYIKDIVSMGVYVIDELSLRKHIQSLPNILNEIWEIMGESGEAIRNSLLWIIETIKAGYNKVSEIVAAVLRGDSVSQVASIIEKLVERYDMFIKDLHVSFIRYIEDLWNRISYSVSQQWYRFLRLVEPLFIRVIHYLEAVVWKASKEVVDFLYDRRNELMTSPYFDRFANFTQDIDRFYRDIKSNDIITNIQKYSGLVIQFLKERYFTFVPFGKELKDVIDEILSELRELKKLPSVHYALEKMQQLYDRANYLYEYLEIRAKIESAVRLIHAKLVDISQTALEAESKYREAKTKFIFDPNQGLMCLEQKLPMSWHAFNQTPEFQEIPEYRAIADMRSYFVTSNTTFWTLYYQYKPYTEPSNWLPPFKAQAMIVGLQHYTTFDGRHFDFTGTCTYLLARDFVRNTFAVLVKYSKQPGGFTHKIIVLMGKKAIELDVFSDTVKLISNDPGETKENLRLPMELNNRTAYVYQKENVVIVERKDKQFLLECNLKFNLCTLELSGWYYGKTAGLLGTMDNEKMDDTMSSDGLVLKDVGAFARSWAVDEDCPRDETNLARVEHRPVTTGLEDDPLNVFCHELFLNKSSEFSACFNVIVPEDYWQMCMKVSSIEDACSVAVAYMQACTFHDTYLRIPDRCTTCGMLNGEEVAEGDFKRLDGNSVPRSADVVFVVEAKECNRDVRSNRSVEYLVSQLSKELKDRGLDNNRWSLVAFGGDGVYDQPRSVVLDSQIFTKNVARFVERFDDLPVGDGNHDVFAAIGFASKLVFRAGVSKTFILMPCSHCEPENQTLDYAVLHQVLLEHDITLHILMDGDFQFGKERLNKILFGLDASKAYTKKDARTLSGDADLRRQVKLSKSALGYCTPLSLETNGTIFSGDKLRFDKLASIKKFASVFSKRVAQTATPAVCQLCECTADNDGVTQMECTPCVYPSPVTVDFMTESYNINETMQLSVLQPLDFEYGQVDGEDE